MLSNCLSGGLIVWYLTREEPEFRLDLRRLRIRSAVLKKMISIAIVVLMVLGLMIPVFASAGTTTDLQQYMWVNCPDGKRLNVRTEPSTKSRAIASLWEIWKLRCCGGSCVI